MFFSRKPDTDGQVEQFRRTPGAVLLDVRTPEEFAEGHIPGSVNLPVGEQRRKSDLLPDDPDAPIYVYCLSGARSAQMVMDLHRLGYTHVYNIGGIRDYTGDLEF